MNLFQANILLYAYPPEHFSWNSKPRMSSLSKKIEEISLLNPIKFRIFHHRNLSSFCPQDHACAFTSGDHQKHYTPLFCLLHIKVKNSSEDKVKYEVNSGQRKAHVVLKIPRSDNKDNNYGLPLTKSLVQPCEVS